AKRLAATIAASARTFRDLSCICLSPFHLVSGPSQSLPGIGKNGFEEVEARLQTRVPAPEAHEKVRRDDPDEREDDERRRRRAEEERQGQHEPEREREDEVRSGDDRQHDLVHGVEERVWRETEQRTSQLPARTCRESSAGAP